MSKSHHPPHVLLDDTWYIITSSIYQKRPLMKTTGHKELVQDQLEKLVHEFEFILKAWVI